MVTALTGAVSSPDLLTVTSQFLIKRTVNSLLGEGAVHVLMFVRWEGLSPSRRLSSQKPRRREKKTKQTPVWFIKSQLLELATLRSQYPSTGGLSPIVPVVPAQSFAL